MNEHELRELLKLIRGVEHFIERCLRSEQEKNEERTKKVLEAQGIDIVSDEEKDTFLMIEQMKEEGWQF